MTPLANASPNPLVAHCFAAYDYDVAVDKFDFAPAQSPDMRWSRCKKILVQGDEPQTLSVQFLFWFKGAIFGVENKNKLKTKIGLLLTLFLELVKQFYKLNGL